MRGNTRQLTGDVGIEVEEPGHARDAPASKWSERGQLAGREAVGCTAAGIGRAYKLQPQAPPKRLAYRRLSVSVFVTGGRRNTEQPAAVTPHSLAIHTSAAPVL